MLNLLVRSLDEVLRRELGFPAKPFPVLSRESATKEDLVRTRLML